MSSGFLCSAYCDVEKLSYDYVNLISQSNEAFQLEIKCVVYFPTDCQNPAITN